MERGLARHDGSGTLVAIKYLLQNLLSDPEFTEAFRSEAAILASVNDPHVVRLYEYIESPSGAAKKAGSPGPPSSSTTPRR